MAAILPFRAIRPNPLFAQQLIDTAGDNRARSGTLQPLKAQLETLARIRPETQAGQQKAYAEINNNLQNLLAEDRLWREDKPGIYIYESVRGNLRQTGIWALTQLSDYTEGRIKTHEHTLRDNVRRQKNYRAHTGLEGSPVVLAYPPDVLINRIITDTKAGSSKSSVGNRFGFHRLWKIEHKETLELLVAAFALIPTVYLADGHHRLESAAALAAEHEASGGEVFATVSSLYLSTDQLRVREFDRVVLPDPPLKKEELFSLLLRSFHLQEATGNRPVRPEGQHNLGLYVQGSWYHLLTKEPPGYCGDDCACIGAALLQEKVLGPILGITDPQQDSRLKCVGGDDAFSEMQALMTACRHTLVFTLCALSVTQLVRLADAGGVLPPKSTWIEPKIPYGLILFQHEHSGIC